jgi:predicted Zn-dependent peptidase
LLKTKGIDLRDLNIIAVVDKNHVILSLLRKVQAISFVSSYALKALEECFESLKKEFVKDEEIQKIKNQIKSSFAYISEDITHQAYYIGYYEILSTYKEFEEYIEKINKITKEDIQEVAKKYLVKDKMTIGILEPQPQTQPQKPIFSVDKITNRGIKEGKISKIPHIKTKWTMTPPERIELENGIVFIIKENFTTETIGISGIIDAGSMYDPHGKNGLANLVSELIIPKEEKNKLEFLGAKVSFDCRREKVEFSIRCLKENFEEVVKIVSKCLVEPSFLENEILIKKNEIITRISGQKENGLGHT